MTVILACLLTVLGTLWTPTTGYQMSVINDTTFTAHVSVVDATFVKGLDTGETPDPANFANIKVHLPSAVTIKPKSAGVIAFPLGVDIDSFYNAMPECEDAQ